jgi:glucose-1-phosphatase
LAVLPREVSTPRLILFDIGRVIVGLNLERAFAPVAAAWKRSEEPREAGETSAAKIWEAIQADAQWQAWQEGRVSPQEWHHRITRRLHIPLGFEDFCAAWNSALDPEPILGDSLFAHLGEHCRLGLLSNTDPLHSEHIERHFSFTRHFPTRVYSCRVGSSKPAAAIYKEAMRLVKAKPADTLFIDDVAEFADAARQVGMDAIHFENPVQLGRELARRGLRIS